MDVSHFTFQKIKRIYSEHVKIKNLTWSPFCNVEVMGPTISLKIKHMLSYLWHIKLISAYVFYIDDLCHAGFYFQIARANGHNQILSNALRVLLHSFGLNQSTLVLQNMFASQRALVTRVS